MERHQQAVESYGTEPETTPYLGIEVVNEPAEKYSVQSAQSAQSEYDQKLPASETLPPKSRICGLSRAVFLLVVALSTLALVVIGLGVGLGVALSKARTTDGSNSESSSSTSLQPSDICPNAAHTTVKGSPGDMLYRVQCSTDFGGSKETLSSLVTVTWDECLQTCNNMNYVQDRSDIGCTWNPTGTAQQRPGTCWCVGGANKTTVQNEGTVAAVPMT